MSRVTGPLAGHFKTPLSSFPPGDIQADMFSLEGVSSTYCNYFQEVALIVIVSKGNKVFYCITRVSVV